MADYAMRGMLRRMSREVRKATTRPFQAMVLQLMRRIYIVKTKWINVYPHIRFDASSSLSSVSMERRGSITPSSRRMLRPLTSCTTSTYLW